MSINSQHGFTLIELILVIMLVGILAVVGTVFILPPFQAAADIERRAMLVDAADLAVNRITREVRNALPNSLKVSTNPNQIEFISTITHGRYRRLPAPDGSSVCPPPHTDTFVPVNSSGCFEVLGELLDANAVQPSPGAADTNCGTAAVSCLSVYNTGQPELNAWKGQNLAVITKAEESHITYESGPFKTHSPQQRFHIIGETVSYICAGGELRRYAGYGVSGDPADVAGRLVADNITSCKFKYQEEYAATRRGLLTVRLDLEADGESIFLLGQAQVLNTP